jgi:hypothetical protein
MAFSGSTTHVDLDVTIVLTTEIAVNKIMVDAVYGQFLQVLQQLLLKFGQVVAAELAAHVLTVVCTQFQDKAVTTQLKQSKQPQDVSTQCALADHGHVKNHILVQQVWAVVRM